MHWQERYEQEANKEYQAYLSQAAEQLLAQAAAGRYGKFYMLWRAIAQKATAQAAIPVLYGVIRKALGRTHLHTRYHATNCLGELVEKPASPELTQLLKAVKHKATTPEALETALANLSTYLHKHHQLSIT